MLTGKIVDHLAGFSHVSPLEVKDRFTFNNEEFHLDFVSFAAEDFKSKVNVTDETLAAFFESRKENYKTEPQYKLNYISFPIEAPAANSLTDDKSAQDLLSEQNKSLTFNTANAAYEQIILAGSLEKYATTYNVEILETDYFSKSKPSQDLVTMPAALRTAFTLGKGELSSLIEDGAGYSIIYVKDIKDPEIPPLEKVKGMVIKDFTAEEAKNLARQAAESLLKTLRTGGEWQAELAKLGIAAEESGPVSRANRYSTKLPSQVINLAFALSSASPYPENIGEEGEKYYVLHFKEKKEPSADQFAAEEETLKQQLKQEKQLQLLTAWVSRLREKAEITTNERLFE
jgi:peptidyl-prolyl cis-trans isomerase D